MAHEKTEPIRIDRGLLKQLRKLAARKGRTLKAQVEVAIVRELARPVGVD